MLEHLAGRARAMILALTAGTALALVCLPTLGSRAGASNTGGPIHTVFQILLENESESSTFPGTGTELDKLAKQGVFFTNYFSTGHASLDNYIALMSGQAQYTSTSQDCPYYHDGGGSVDAKGFYQPLTPQDVGCVYPASVKTLADQLGAAGISWRGYMQDMGNTPTRETNPCGQPAIGGVAIDPTVGGLDQTQLATSTDQYAARHNPFPYFHSLIDHSLLGSTSPCEQNVAPLSSLAADLASGHVGAFNFITPNLCNDGHDSPCKGPGADGSPGAGGLISANAFLSQIVPQIEASDVFKKGGVIVITVDEGSGNASCCGESGQPGIQSGGGGGQVGLVALSPRLTAHTSSCPYNHYSLLRTWEAVFGLTPQLTGIPGSDGAGHLAHAGDTGVNSMLTDLLAGSNTCP
jgi:phosphatidylinositol-3-phosphatase